MRTRGERPTREEPEEDDGPDEYENEEEEDAGGVEGDKPQPPTQPAEAGGESQGSQ